MSRDEMAAALLEVAEGRVPKDRLALKCLLEDMQVGLGGGSNFQLCSSSVCWVGVAPFVCVAVLSSARRLALGLCSSSCLCSSSVCWVRGATLVVS